MGKVLFIGPDPRNLGGIESFGRILKKILKKEMHFLFRDNNKEKVYSAEAFKKIPNSTLMKIVYKIFGGKILRGYLKNFNAIILNTPRDLKYLEKKNKNKKILVQHTTAELFWEREYYLSKDIKLQKKMKERFDRIITLSPYDRKEFVKRFDLDENKVIFIRHTSYIPLIKEIKTKNRNLIIVSRLFNHAKRIDLAIEAMKKLPNYTLNIYGNGPDEKKLKDLAKGINNVVFHGATNKVQEKLDESSIYIITSDYEGYPVSSVEASRRGLPIVLRNTFTSAQDIARGNGILLEKEWNENKFVEAVKQTYDNYEEYSKKSIELGKRHDFEVIKKEWKKLIKSLEGEN